MIELKKNKIKYDVYEYSGYRSQNIISRIIRRFKERIEQILKLSNVAKNQPQDSASKKNWFLAAPFYEGKIYKIYLN